jgi:hypothetical protein
MQWKKMGVDFVVWSISEQTSGLGYSLFAFADYEMLTFRSEQADKYLFQTNVWENISTVPLEFTLSADSYVSLGYSVNVAPQLNNAHIIRDRKLEYVSARISVDGIAFVSGANTHGTNGWNPRSGILQGFTTVPLTAGSHVFSLQWKKLGGNFKSWSNSPSFLDGFAASRNFFVLVSKQQPATISSNAGQLSEKYTHTRSVLVGDGKWYTLPGTQRNLSLVKETAVVVSYLLPVSQVSNPNLTSSSWQSLSKIQSRVWVDGVLYSASAVQSTSKVVDSISGKLALILAAGSHSLCLQWRSDTGVDWQTVTQLGDGFSESEEFLTVLTSHNAAPVISFNGGVDSIRTKEDAVVSVGQYGSSGLSIGYVPCFRDSSCLNVVMAATSTKALKLACG